MIVVDIVDVIQGLPAKDARAVTPENITVHARGMVYIPLKTILDELGCKCCLTALQFIPSFDFPVKEARHIAADIAELAIPFAAKDPVAAFKAIDAIRNARWFLSGQADMGLLDGGAEGIFNHQDNYLKSHSEDGIRHALEAAVQACPVRNIEEVMSCAIKTYQEFMLAVACNEPGCMKAAEEVDKLLLFSTNKKTKRKITRWLPKIRHGIADCSEANFPELEDRVDFIIRTHLGW